MKRIILTLLFAMAVASTAIAQNGRVVQGVVLDSNSKPIPGAKIGAIGGLEIAQSASDGRFTITVAPYVTQLKAQSEGYIAAVLDIDGSFLMFKLKVDKSYYESMARAAEEAARKAEEERLAQERAEAAKAKAEAERMAMERAEAAKAKAEAQARIEAAKKAEEQARIEAAKKAEAERLANEKAAAAKAKAEEQARIDAQKKVEAERLAKEKAAAAKAKAEEQARIEAAKKAEAERLANEKATAAKAKAEEQARIEAAKKAEAERIANEKAAAAKAKAEEQARAAAAKKAAADKRRKMYAEVQKGFGSIVDISYLWGLNYYPSFGATYTAGYRFNNQIYLGAGAGVCFNLDGGKAVRSVANSYYNSDIYGDVLNPSLISVPVFAYFKANFIDRRCSPFFALAVGANLSNKQTLLLDLYEVQYSTMGAFANPQLGVNFRTTKKTSIYLAAGFQCFTVPSCIKYTGYNAVLRSTLGYGVDFHFGFTF